MKRFASVLEETGFAQSPEDFVMELERNYYGDRNDAQHISSNDVLRAELKELHDAGVHDLMATTMPAAAYVVRHFDKFLELLL